MAGQGSVAERHSVFHLLSLRFSVAVVLKNGVWAYASLLFILAFPPAFAVLRQTVIVSSEAERHLCVLISR